MCPRAFTGRATAPFIHPGRHGAGGSFPGRSRPTGPHGLVLATPAMLARAGDPRARTQPAALCPPGGEAKLMRPRTRAP
jgi:hypothetical protein